MTIVEGICPETIDHRHGLTDRHGTCPYCRRKVGSVQPKPSRYRPVRSCLDDAYRRQWDPDWGNHNDDSDPW